MLLDILPNHISPYIIVREFHIGIILCLSQYTENLVHEKYEAHFLVTKELIVQELGFLFLFLSLKSFYKRNRDIKCVGFINTVGGSLCVIY